MYMICTILLLLLLLLLLFFSSQLKLFITRTKQLFTSRKLSVIVLVQYLQKFMIFCYLQYQYYIILVLTNIYHHALQPESVTHSYTAILYCLGRRFFLRVLLKCRVRFVVVCWSFLGAFLVNDLFVAWCVVWHCLLMIVIVLVRSCGGAWCVAVALPAAVLSPSLLVTAISS